MYLVFLQKDPAFEATWCLCDQCPSLLPVAAINTVARSNSGEQWFSSPSCLESIIKGSQGRGSRRKLEAIAEAETMEEGGFLSCLP